MLSLFFTERLSARILDAPLPEGGTRGMSKKKYNISIDASIGGSDYISAALLVSNPFYSFFHYGLALSAFLYGGEDEYAGDLNDYGAYGLRAEAGVNFKPGDRIGVQPFLGLGYYIGSGEGIYEYYSGSGWYDEDESVSSNAIMLSVGLRVPIRLGSSSYIYPFIAFAKEIGGLEGDDSGEEYGITLLSAGLGIMF